MSNIIKFFQYKPVDDNSQKVVVAHPQHFGVLDNEQTIQKTSPAESPEVIEALQMKDQILQDAESFAEEQVRAAMDETAALKEQAQADIEAWWNERRELDQETVEAAMDQGFTQGYEEGLSRAETELREKYDAMLQEASSILEQAYALKQQIIQESEPFLIDLSCSIAEKIVARQLTLEPEWTVDLIRKTLTRRKDTGVIALCVSPSQFPLIQDAREELLLHIDSQAELQIIPDGSVQDHGCVIRSSFGSIDSRIDTQLSEIKNALRQIAIRGEES
ncbi:MULTISPECIES: FliH/SctL family protein [Paenibacillus]|uniref:FliH/SctL family protein n=1 Tax=Paenibacillus TaxID=44249 RepID=UPI0022B8F877|nr:FliH/SctL family protein [Paenibacillus caseinilyticus]MCZ8520056.1 FliH/SctL family protein [Paenibacillus caseinilyticus]